MLLTEARFIKPAELEFRHEVERYEAQSPDLAQRFTDHVEATVLHAMHFPEGGTAIVHRKLQRSVRRFQIDPPFRSTSSRPCFTASSSSSRSLITSASPNTGSGA